MSTSDSGASRKHVPRQGELVKVSVYHNDDAHFLPYRDGQKLTAVACHWIDAPPGGAEAAADWAYRVFNADLDTLEALRDQPGGEATFLAVCVYRLLGLRSLSVGDVVEIRTGAHSRWLACDPHTWRPIPPPNHLSGTSLTAATVYHHLTDQQAGR